MKKVLIGGAWPYANGSLHLGHVACLLPGDVLARYHRAKGDDVCFVSGSDCHGTPITVRAEAEGTTPEIIAEQYHTEFDRDLKKLGFTYDLYGKTTAEFHKEEVRRLFSRIFENGYLIPKVTEQTYCEACGKFLPDRYVEGTCPRCGALKARGDQCDACGALLTPSELVDSACKLCGAPPTQRETEHLYFRLSAFQDKLQSLVNNSQNWRSNAVGLTNRYLKEGLVDRAATRDIEWGIKVPSEGYDDKRIYVWFEAVMGYLTASKELYVSKGEPEGWEDFWNEEALTYYVHGKDNIPFHTLIWPSLLLAIGGLKLPDKIISSEHLTIEGKKLSTSRNWAIWLPDFLERYDPDPLRYYLLANGPEDRDSDFSWREFFDRNNGELLGGYGNFVHRTLIFAAKSFDNRIPDPDAFRSTDIELLDSGAGLFETVGNAVEEGRFREALRDIFEYVRACNKYFDAEQPWITIKTDNRRCATVIYTCIQAIGRLVQLLSPFLPFSSDEIRASLLSEDTGWSPLDLKQNSPLGASTPPFKRLDKKVIEAELSRLGGNGCA